LRRAEYIHPDKESAPQTGLYPQVGRKRRATLRARRLGRRRTNARIHVDYSDNHKLFEMVDESAFQ